MKWHQKASVMNHVLKPDLGNSRRR